VAVFLWWMLAFLGFPLGGLLALVLVGPVEGAVSSALGEALAGAVIGAAGSDRSPFFRTTWSANLS
jgi:hypothetical protein